MNIFVSNLNFKVRSEDLKNLFSQYGEVLSTKVITDKFSGKSRGFGSHDHAERARTQHDVGGAPLRPGRSPERTSAVRAARRRRGRGKSSVPISAPRPRLVATAKGARRALAPELGAPSSAAIVPRGKPPPRMRSSSASPVRSTSSSPRVNAAAEASRWRWSRVSRRAAKAGSTGIEPDRIEHMFDCQGCSLYECRRVPERVARDDRELFVRITKAAQLRQRGQRRVNLRVRNAEHHREKLGAQQEAVAARLVLHREDPARGARSML